MSRRFPTHGIQYKWELILFLLIAAPLGLILAVALTLLRLTRPVVIVRGKYKDRLTKFVEVVDPAIRVARSRNPRTLLFVIVPGRTVNPFLSTAYRRHAFLIDEQSPRMIRLAMTVAALLTRRLTEPSTCPPLQTVWGLPPAIRASDLRPCDNLPTELVIGTKDRPLITFGVKESAYYQSLATRRDLEISMYELDAPRNVDVRNYLEMAEYFVTRGYSVVRLGSVAGKPLSLPRDRGVIDYAYSMRSPCADLELASRARFSVVGACGLWSLAAVFDRPFVITDDYSMYRLDEYPVGNLFIPRRIWSRKLGRCLTYLEITQYDPNVAAFIESGQEDLVYIPNTPREILEVADEMDKRISGTWTETTEDLALRAEFSSQHAFATGRRTFPLQIGTRFLRDHQDLLQ